MSEEQAPDVSAIEKDHQPKTYVPTVPPGSEATREMREVSRRRRDAEEKLQQHLQEADQLHEAHVQAHLKEAGEKDAEGEKKASGSKDSHSKDSHSKDSHG